MQSYYKKKVFAILLCHFISVKLLWFTFCQQNHLATLQKENKMSQKSHFC